MFRQIIRRKLMVHSATSKRALMRGHTDDRAALVVLIQGFHMQGLLSAFFFRDVGCGAKGGRRIVISVLGELSASCLDWLMKKSRKFAENSRPSQNRIGFTLSRHATAGRRMFPNRRFVQSLSG
jgi:hypothetical protein